MGTKRENGVGGDLDAAEWMAFFCLDRFKVESISLEVEALPLSWKHSGVCTVSTS